MKSNKFESCAFAFTLAAAAFAAIGLVVLVMGLFQKSATSEVAGAGLLTSALIVFLFAQIFHIRSNLNSRDQAKPGELKTPYASIKAAERWEQVVEDQNKANPGSDLRQ